MTVQIILELFVFYSVTLLFLISLTDRLTGFVCVCDSERATAAAVFNHDMCPLR